jgi:hypothetical protein
MTGISPNEPGFKDIRAILSAPTEKGTETYQKPSHWTVLSAFVNI